MPDQTLTIDAVIAGRAVSRDEVLVWEAKRLPRAARKIGLAVPPGDLARQRTAFAETKLALGADDVRRRLARDVRASGVVARGLTALSFGRRATSVCDLHVTGGNAGAFVDWFTDAGRDDYARSMIAANPDHFLIDTAPDGRQEVIEATGGSPLATQFFIDYDDTSPLVTPRDPAFPVEAAGVARTGAGLAIGGVRHEFRDDANGFHARLCIEFPWLTAPYLIAQHRWHLACEFSNWIEAAFARR
jgi:hypothetical protein